MNFLYQRINLAINKLKDAKVVKEYDVDVKINKEIPYKDGLFEKSQYDTWKDYNRDTGWGGKIDSHSVFKIKYDIQDKIDGEIRLLLHDVTSANVLVNPQFLVYDENGNSISGLDMWHKEIVLNKNSGTLFVYAYTGMDYDKQMALEAKIIIVNKKIEQLYFDISTLYELLSVNKGTNYNKIVEVTNNAIDYIDFNEKDINEFIKGIDKASNLLKKEFYHLNECSNYRPNVLCVGHTHIDVAWLWTVRQTREKAQRSFSTVIDLMDKYPEYYFMSSQPILYSFVKEDDPKLFAKIKEKVKEGRWEPEGGLWLESDFNMPCGESLVRQINYGKKFFKDEFGIDSKIVWVPDTFGFSASIPQILKKAGMEWFVTSKISWNDTNIFPYDLFSWQGIDGSAINVYNLTAQDCPEDGKIKNPTTYNAIASPNHIIGAWNRFREKNLTDTILFPFGYGDGGGGATYEQLENIRRLNNNNFIDTPNVKTSTLKEFFTKLDKQIEDKKLPKWRGEYYLEFHRGTYTSVARNKLLNRKNEYNLLNTEWLGNIARCLCNNKYDFSAMDENWKLLLQNQFHDILPGSGIKEIYDESDLNYQKLDSQVNKIKNEFLDTIASKINTKGGYLVFNPTSSNYSGCLKYLDNYYYVKNIPAKGYKVLESLNVCNDVNINNNVIENSLLKVSFDKDYNIISIIDKQYNKEIVPQNQKTGVFQIFDESYEYEFEAWEIKELYKRKYDLITNCTNVSIYDCGDKKGFIIERKYKNSTIKEIVSLQANSKLISFDCDIDFKEHQSLLKVLFPLELNAQYAKCDIQFGTLDRPIFANTSWEKAKYEVCCHKFADISQGDYGISVINDCKYGYDFEDGNIRLTLIKSSERPYAASDIRKHTFSFAIYPHIGNYEQSDIMEQSYMFNNPMFARKINQQNGTLDESFSLVSISSNKVFIEATKPVENGFIVRAYEAYNTNTKTKLIPGVKIKNAWLCDLNDNIIEKVDIVDNKISLDFKPFEILSIKLEV